MSRDDSNDFIGSGHLPPRNLSLVIGQRRLYEHKAFHNEAIMWKCLIRHPNPNIAPFLGVSAVFPICLISEWMTFGTVTGYLEAHHTGEHTD